MDKFILKPIITLYPGIKVDKDTVLSYENDSVTQMLSNLEFHTIARVKGENYESTYDTVIHLNEGDILIFEEERGYVKPAVDQFMTVAEAIGELESIRELG